MNITIKVVKITPGIKHNNILVYIPTLITFFEIPIDLIIAISFLKEAIDLFVHKLMKNDINTIERINPTKMKDPINKLINASSPSVLYSVEERTAI